MSDAKDQTQVDIDKKIADGLRSQLKDTSFSALENKDENKEETLSPTKSSNEQNKNSNNQQQDMVRNYLYMRAISISSQQITKK